MTDGVQSYRWDAAGRLVTATVFTLTTHFSYNGDGTRMAVSVVGRGTTSFVPDYAAGGHILVEDSGVTRTLYVYGRDCLGEVRDGEWLYYLSDGEGYVRQGVDAQGQVSSAWVYTPDGQVMEGPEGPVTHLICGGVYDWSTGLLYKGGRYFDPTLGIWLALGPLAVIQGWMERKRKGKRRVPWYALVLVMGLGVAGVLTACGPVQPGGTPACTELPLSKSVYIVPREPGITKGGGYLWDSDFRLTEPTQVGGWVVQHIHLDSYYKDAEGETPKPITYPDSHYTMHYWEAWRVYRRSVAPAVVGKRGTNDSYVAPDWNAKNADPGGIFGAHRFGKRVMQGWARFYEMGDLPQPPFSRHPLYGTNDFMVTDPINFWWWTPPWFWEESGSGTTHNLEVEWDKESGKAWGTATWGGQNGIGTRVLESGP